MSQKTSKRTRKQTEDSSQTIEGKKETEENPETVDIKDKPSEKDTENNSNSKENSVQESDSNAKDVENVSNSTENNSNTENTQCLEIQSCFQNIIETESLEQSENDKIEQEEVECEMEPLVLEEQTNGVQILVQTTDELTENRVDDAIEESKKEMQENDLVVEEKVVNGESHSESEEIKLQNNEDESTNESENIDGEKCYKFEDAYNTLQTEPEIYSETLADISTRAVVGSDTSRYEENFEYSKFLTATKDQSIGSSLRHLSARRSIRTVKTFPVDGNTYNLNYLDVRKRKNCDDDSQVMKRAKKDSPGLMSYLGSAFKKSDVASSTPKLTGYRENSFDNNVSKIGLNNSNEKPANKWCSLM